MRKFISILAIFLFLSLFQTVFPKNIFAGPLCDALPGGQCGAACLVAVKDCGPLDCSGLTPRCCASLSAVCPTPIPTPTPLPNPCDPDHTYTALGCLPNDPSAFVGWLLGAVIGLGGGIAFLLIVYGGFLVVMSSGDPEKLNNGKEMIVSALAGLLLIVFSVILLRIIGVDILQIPGFNK